MANTDVLRRCRRGFLPALLAWAMTAGVFAHDAGNLNEFTVDRANDAAREKILEAQNVLTKVLRGGGKDKAWPLPDLERLKDDIRHMKEDADLSMDYLANQGVNIRNPQSLMANPLAGRTVSATRALETGLALLEHAASLETREAFVKEVYTRGMSYYMYDLLDAYRDKMDLYAALMEKQEGE
jgi:hypothetical protein